MLEMSFWNSWLKFEKWVSKRHYKTYKLQFVNILVTPLFRFPSEFFYNLNTI